MSFLWWNTFANVFHQSKDIFWPSKKFYSNFHFFTGILPYSTLATLDSIHHYSSDMTRNKINRNPKLTREQLMDINKQHVCQSRLLIAHMEAVEQRVRLLEQENTWLKIQKEETSQRLKELEKETTEKIKQLEEETAEKIKELEEMEEMSKKKAGGQGRTGRRQTLLVADSHRRAMNLAQIEDELGGQLFVAPGYNSGEWPRSRMPLKSQKIVVKEKLEEMPEVTDLILQLSCNDISNISHITDAKLAFSMAEKSTRNTVGIAVAALQEYPMLNNVLILPRTPRMDCYKLADLSEHANTILLDEVSKSGFCMQIKIGSLNAIQTKTQDQIHQVFGSRFSAKTDFIHLRGQRGQQLYTGAIIQSIRNTLN